MQSPPCVLWHTDLTTRRAIRAFRTAAGATDQSWECPAEDIFHYYIISQFACPNCGLHPLRGFSNQFAGSHPAPDLCGCTVHNWAEKDSSVGFVAVFDRGANEGYVEEVHLPGIFSINNPDGWSWQSLGGPHDTVLGVYPTDKDALWALGEVLI